MKFIKSFYQQWHAKKSFESARLPFDFHASFIGSHRSQRPLFDFYYYLLSVSWGKFIWLTFSCYVISNLIFAGCYWLIPSGIEGIEHNRFLDSLFFSVQTMATIGYGKLTPHGVMANTLVAVEAYFGTVYAALTTGISFARFTKHTAGIRFSKFILIGKENQFNMLRFRLANQRSVHIIDASLRFWLIREVVNKNGEIERKPVNIVLTHADRPVMAYIWTAKHLIDTTSPLYDVSLEQMQREKWEFLVTFKGYHEGFSDQIYARHVYEPNHIRFHARFADIVVIDHGEKIIDFNRLDLLINDTHDHQIGPKRLD